MASLLYATLVLCINPLSHLRQFLVVDLSRRSGVIDYVVFGAGRVEQAAGVYRSAFERLKGVEFGLRVSELFFEVFGATQFWQSRLCVVEVGVFAHSQHVVGSVVRFPPVLGLVFAPGLARDDIELPRQHR